MPTKTCALLRVGVAVVELGDAAPADQRHEALVRARPLGQRHGEDGLALLAHLGALGDEAQAVEVGVGAAGDGDELLVADLLARHVRLGAGDGDRARRLEDRARVLEDVLDRGADRVGVDQDHLVDQFARDAEGLLADLLHRDAVGKEAHVVERHAVSRGDGTRHGVRIDGLHADDLHVRPQALHVGRHAGDQPAAAHRDEDRVDRLRALAQDLHADGALAGDHVRIVVGMHERELARRLEALRLGIGLGVGIAVQAHVGRRAHAPRRP